MNKRIVMAMAGLMIAGCATPLEKCQERGYWQSYGYNSVSECARAVAEERQSRRRALAAGLSDSSSGGPSSQAIMSCGMKPMSCYSGCGCQCIGGSWQSVCH